MGDLDMLARLLELLFLVACGNLCASTVVMPTVSFHRAGPPNMASSEKRCRCGCCGCNRGGLPKPVARDLTGHPRCRSGHDRGDGFGAH